MNRNGREAGKTIKILFLGQCLNYGYAGVPQSATFNSVAAAALRARFPNASFIFRSKYLYHPRGLNALLAHRMVLSRPDIVIINAPAMYAATSWRVNRVYEIAPEIVDTARSLLQKISAKINNSSGLPQTTPLDKLFVIHPPIEISEYERLLDEAVKLCQENFCRVILMGPGRFNEDTHEDYQAHSPALWMAVNRMVISLGQRLNVSVIDSYEALGGYGGEVFLPNNHRWSQAGHEIIAREVESVLAREITRVHSA
ncbi:MAG TPA: hypothetical protein VIG62_06135 [Blastocatellia bacterium]|jgi:hypothetical protein